MTAKHPGDMLSGFATRLAGAIEVSTSAHDRVKALPGHQHRDILLPSAVEKAELVVSVLFELQEDFDAMREAIETEVERLELLAEGTEGKVS